MNTLLATLLLLLGIVAPFIPSTNGLKCINCVVLYNDTNKDDHPCYKNVAALSPAYEQECDPDSTGDTTPQCVTHIVWENDGFQRKIHNLSRFCGQFAYPADRRMICDRYYDDGETICYCNTPRCNDKDVRDIQYDGGGEQSALAVLFGRAFGILIMLLVLGGLVRHRFR